VGLLCRTFTVEHLTGASVNKVYPEDRNTARPRRPALRCRPADGTAQVLAPLASVRTYRTYRAQRSAFAWLAEREVLCFLGIWHLTIVGHVISALLFVVVFGFAS